MPFICNSQEYCKDCDWDWTFTDDSNWMWKKSGGEIGTMYYFLGQSHVNNVPDLDDIAESNDYLPKHGWALLYKDFGCESGVKFPYFILYNKYTGIMRIFTFLYNQAIHESANGGIITVRFKDDSKKTSILTHTNKISYATSRYHPLDNSINDIGSVFLDGDGSGDDTFVTGYWCVADFATAFDHMTPREIGDGINPGDFELIFDFDEIKESTIVLEGKKLPSESTLRKIFDDEKQELLSYESTTNTNLGNYKISQQTKTNLTDISKDTDNEFISFLFGVSKYAPVVGKYLETAAGIFDFFAGKANSTTQKVEIMPTISKGHLELQGSIINKASLGNIALELPGTPHYQENQTPYYDCPLGVVGLEEEPILRLKR